MGLLDWLKRRAPGIDAPSPTFPGQTPDDDPIYRNPPFALAPTTAAIPPRPANAAKAATDPHERRALHGTFETVAQLDQINVAIDYTDANGARTRRAITIREIGSSENFPVITALCHLRHEVRTFRVDRIEAFITRDGEVIEPAQYIKDCFGIDLAIFAKAPKGAGSDPAVEARKARDALRPMLSILVLAARTDNEFHAEELDVILRYAERELLHMERLGRLPALMSIPMLDQLTKSVRQMRPTADTLADYVAFIDRQPDAVRNRFWKALDEVFGADGDFTDEEAELHDIIQEMRFV